MASKPSALPPPLRPADRLLACCIPLPPNPVFVAHLYKPGLANPESLHDAIELARRAIVSRNRASSLLESVLSSVRCGRDPTLHLFIITSHDTTDAAFQRLAQLPLDSLDLLQESVFPIQDLSSATSDHTASRIHAHFLDAVRSHILSEISDSDLNPHPLRLQDGFVLERKSTLSDWASGWNHGSHNRPIAHFRLQVQLSYNSLEPSHLVLHAIPAPTPYTALPASPHPGSPIILLPYGTPAYYLNSYSGPSNTLVKQFRDSLQGLGVGNWEELSRSDSSQTSFIIGWIRVENKQGEDKGTLFIWPSRLCLAYSDSYSHRSPLDYIPEMPAPLQPSPQIPQDAHVSGDSPEETRYLHHHPWIFEPPQTPHSDPLRAFHSLTMSRTKDIRSTANEVGGYVDSVVRERERERERLKREREAGTGTSPKLARQTPSTQAPNSTPFPLPPTPQASQPPTHNGSHVQAQIFYPSPPQSGQIQPPTMLNTSPDMKPENALPEESPTIEPSEKMTFSAPPATSDVSGNGYDPFNNGPGWSQSADPYMDEGMGMDFAMDMGMDFDMNSSRSTTTTMYNNHRATLNFNDDAITDDDFSFFDLPSAKVDGSQKFAIPSVPPASASIDIHRESSHPWSFPTRASPTIEEVRASGPGPPMQPALNNAPWTPATQDGHTPHAFNDSFESRAPDLLPSSPGPSPDFQSSPETPTVQLVFDPAAKSEPMPCEHGPIAFDPIPFSTVHKSNDTKYTVGKFALPTPSPEPGYDVSPLPPPTPSTWKAKYFSITDPRERIIQRLIAAKRKDSPNPQARRNSFARGSWLDDEDFVSTSDNDSAQAMDISSDTDSDDDDSLDCESPFDTRPTTPSPSYLPLGPTLLHFRFDHGQLLPISTPLRSPGAIALSTSLSSSAPFAVPTPVSPAAALGAASEQSKSLESAAFAIVTEFVENPLWAEIWSANNHRTGSLPNAWPDDIKAAADLLQRVRSAGGLPDLASLCGLDPSARMEPLEPPFISVGRNNTVIQLLPPALRFWEKAGLGPKGGHKDLEVYAIYEDVDDQRRSSVDMWLTAAASAYQASHLGQFIRGSTNPANDALFPVRFDTTFRKTLVSFINNIINAPLPIVILLFVPVTVMTMASPVLRQILSSSKKALGGAKEGHIIFHLVPDSHLFDIEHSPKGYPLLDELCSALYNRVLVGVERNLSCRMLGTSTRTTMLFQEPSFSLARPQRTKVTYVRSTHSSLDVVDRFTLLHVGYQVSPCKKWVFASCIDQRGEMYDLGLWLMHLDGEDEEESDEGYEASVIGKVWTFTLEFARKANVEWRIVITKLGLMSPTETQAWTDRINREASGDYAPMHITLVSADSRSPWTLVETNRTTSSPARNPRSSSATKNTYFSDASASYYAVFPGNQTTAAVPPEDNNYSTSLISEPSTTAQDCTESDGDIPHRASLDDDLPHPIPLTPLSTSSLIRVPCQASETPISMLHIHVLKHLHPPSYPDAQIPPEAPLQEEITRNFYELSILSAIRFRLDRNPVLPFHLAAVDSMRSCLDCDWDQLENPVEP